MGVSIVGAQWLHSDGVSGELWTWGHDSADDLTTAKVVPAEVPSCDGRTEDGQTADRECVLGQQSQENELPTEYNLNLKQLSLLEISLEDICPGPARGEMYGYQCNDASDTESYYSLSLDEGDEGAATDADNGPEDGSSIGIAVPRIVTYGNFSSVPYVMCGTADHTEVSRKIARKYLYRKSLVPTQGQLESMGLVDGENEIIFEVDVRIVCV